MIEVINREILIPREEYNIGTCYDDNTETRHFHLKRVTSSGIDLAALTFNLDIQYADGNTDAASLVKEVTDKDINLVLTINNSMLQVPGTVLIQIRALDEDGVCKWTSYKSAFFVEDHINTPGHYEGDLTQFEQYEAEWGKVRDNVNQLNLRMDEVVRIREESPATEVEEEVIDARVGADNVIYRSLGTAIRKQFENAYDVLSRKYDTVALMKDDTELSDGMYALTGGYYSANDGGGALYRISETEPTTHYETLANGLYAELISDVANAKQWGAVGDGVTDDTIAIQRMLNENKNKCLIVFPKGTYKISSQLNIPSDANSVVYFFETGGVIKCTHNGNGIYFEQSNTETGFCRFENLVIHGTNPSFSAMSEKVSNGAGIYLKKAYHNVFKNCYVTGFKYGLKIETGIGNTFTNDTYFRFNEYGIYLCDSATNMNKWIGCSIRQNWVCGICIDGTETTDMPMFNVFDDCLIESNIPHLQDDYDDNNGFGIWMKRTNCNIFSNSYFENHRRTVYFSENVSGCKFVSDRYVNNKGSLFEFAGINIRNNVFLYNMHESSTLYDSIVISTDYNDLIHNYFNYCEGLVLSNANSYTNFPKLTHCVKNSSINGDYWNRVNIGESYQNPGLTQSDTYPYIYNKVLYTKGYGEIQLGSRITEDIEITSIEGMKRGDVLVLNNYQNSHKVTLKSSSTGTGALTLKNNKDVILKGYNETIVLYKSYTGMIVEISRNFNFNKRDGAITLTKTNNVSSSSSNAYRIDNIILISVDVTMPSANNTWVDILTINIGDSSTAYMTYGSVSSTDGTNSRVLQCYNNAGTLTLRIEGCEAKTYRGLYVFVVQ